jgi:hypothetical protein
MILRLVIRTVNQETTKRAKGTPSARKNENFEMIFSSLVNRINNLEMKSVTIQ